MPPRLTSLFEADKLTEGKELIEKMNAARATPRVGLEKPARTMMLRS